MSDRDQIEAQRRVATIRRWKRVIRFAQIVVGLAIFATVWLIGFRSDDSAAPVVPDTTSQFSLDLNVISSTDHDLVYAVEQRARPFYRILEFDPSSGAVETVFTVPDDAIIYGIALSPDRETLAVSYSRDFALDGNGLWQLDLTSGDFVELAETQADRYLVDPIWAPDGSSILVTHVDRSTEDEQLAIAEVGLDGSVEIQANNGVDPAIEGENLYYLDVGADNARRSIGVVDANGEQTVVDFEARQFDLDHLVAINDRTHVAVLETTDEGLVTLGEPADAHGNHNVPSTWWQVSVDGSQLSTSSTGIEPIIVYDAAATQQGQIVYATLEGLSLAGNERIDLIKSRAIRFVAG